MASERIRIVTDSLAWIPADLASEHDIRVVPLHVTIGEQHFTETVDLTNQEFYRRLREAKVLPKTSQPAAGEFLEAYREVADGATAIISIHASSKLSGTYHSAVTAAAMLSDEQPGLRIETMDTLTIATAQGMVVLRVAEDAGRCRSPDEVLANVCALAP